MFYLNSPKCVPNFNKHVILHENRESHLRVRVMVFNATFNNILGTDHLTCKGGGYGFLFRSEFFFRTTRVSIFIFFVAKFFSRNQH